MSCMLQLKNNPLKFRGRLGNDHPNAVFYRDFKAAGAYVAPPPLAKIPVGF